MVGSHTALESRCVGVTICESQDVKVSESCVVRQLTCVGVVLAGSLDGWELQHLGVVAPWGYGVWKLPHLNIIVS